LHRLPAKILSNFKNKKIMNSNVMPSIVQIDKKNLQELVSEVKETLATGIDLKKSPGKQKNFSIVDLWNCRNSMRTATSLRRH
jgi:hypothetical protein